MRSLNINSDVGTVTGFSDMPPYVTMVAPGLNALAIAVDAAPPTLFRPSFGLAKPDAAAYQQTMRT